MGEFIPSGGANHRESSKLFKHHSTDGRSLWVMPKYKLLVIFQLV